MQLEGGENGLGDEATECLSITPFSAYRWSHFPAQIAAAYDSRPLICMLDRQQTAACMSK